MALKPEVIAKVKFSSTEDAAVDGADASTEEDADTADDPLRPSAKRSRVSCVLPLLRARFEFLPRPRPVPRKKAPFKSAPR